MEYNHKKIEKKWQKKWEEQDLYKADDNSKKPKKYILDMFPYPSGAGLHVGHPEGYTATDIYSRYLRMNGFNVMHPMGWDAFGLPAENYAIKEGVHPAKSTNANIKIFKRQIKSLGLSYDWSREINTSFPEYYKWTQWFFLFLYKNDLAYKKKAKVNWCDSCQTVLANEQVINGKCDRCDSDVEQKEMSQWFFKITDYADRLIEDLDKIDWPKSIKAMQKNWIGRGEGINITYKFKEVDKNVSVFTTRPDTNFGATFLTLAPDSDFVKENIDNFPNAKDVKKYVEQAGKKTELERMSDGKKKTGVFTGWHAINNLNNREMPVYIGDFVLSSVGTGAVVGVPGHDVRDFEFAQAMKLDIIRVVVGSDGDTSEITKVEQVQEETGKMINSDFLDGLDIHEATEKIKDYLEKEGWGERIIRYKLRDWLVSRQRYWGAPIPIIYCDECKNKDKKTVLLIHGTSGHGRKNWFGWLADELTALGHEVIAPNLPNADEPVLEEWIKELIKHKNRFNNNTVVIGHSLGGPAALQLVNELKIKIDKLILVAPTSKGMNWEEFAKKHPDNPVVKQKIFSDVNIDYNKIEKNTDKVLFYYSDNDFYIQDASNEYYKKNLKGEYKLFKGYNHFSIPKGGLSEFPEILEEIAGKESQVIGEVPVPEKDLPVELPTDVDFKPTGESPLQTSKTFHNVKCPKCGAAAKRESDTMDTFVCSSWYQFRFTDSDNTKEFASKEAMKKWMPVDLYVGGAEHAVLHLMYARFFTKALFDKKYIDFDEPFLKLRNQGMILAEDGRKMSKSLGNVINPDDVVESLGADSLRLYEMFMGPLEDTKPWQTDGIKGVRRFLEKVWTLHDNLTPNPSLKMGEGNHTLLHKTIKKITEDIENMKFNTAISAMMIFTNEAQKEGISKEDFTKFLIILAPFAPHMAEELWEQLGNKESIFLQPWPKYDEKLIKDETIQLVVQVNGKLRDTIEVKADISEKEAKEKALASDKVKKWTNDKEIVKIIFVPGKLINIVIK